MTILAYEDSVAEFKQLIRDGHKVEVHDWMPDEYRGLVSKFIERHAMSELMGALPERSWILRAPSLHRKLAVTSKVQDEVGHAQLLLRLVDGLIWACLCGGSTRQAYLRNQMCVMVVMRPIVVLC